MSIELNLPAELVPAVCAWFAENGRSLPWRETSDPYKIWLSEIMLQQTRIEAVIPYYRRFLEAFPDPASLAQAPDDRLMKLWEGLGYYSRARNLKKAAVIIARDYGGSLPPDAALLRSLPGIGDYTAGAVASIAFGLPEPAVDGNVLRVIARLTALEDDVTLPATKKAVTDSLRRIYPMGKDAALFTEGLMELGDAVCPPSGPPSCGSCPLAGFCRARASGTVSRYPVRSPKKERRVEERSVFLLRASDGKYLLRRRKEGLLRGLFEFPSLPGRMAFPEDGDVRRALDLLIPGIVGETDSVPSPAYLGAAKHLFTHVEWQMFGFEIDLPVPAPKDENPKNPPDEVWAEAAAIRDELAVPTAFRAWMRKLR